MLVFVSDDDTTSSRAHVGFQIPKNRTEKETHFLLRGRSSPINLLAAGEYQHQYLYLIYLNDYVGAGTRGVAQLHPAIAVRRGAILEDAS
jgi:hypothetical protein